MGGRGLPVSYVKLEKKKDEEENPRQVAGHRSHCQSFTHVQGNMKRAPPPPPPREREGGGGREREIERLKTEKRPTATQTRFLAQQPQCSTIGRPERHHAFCDTHIK